MTTITAQEIRSLHFSYEFRELLVAVNAGTATMAKINGSNVSLVEKKLLIDLLGTVTRAGVMGSLIDLEQKLAALREQTSAGGADPTAANWKTRVIANSGTVSDATLQLVSDFCVSIKGGAHPSFTAMLRTNVFAGTGLAACLTPLVIGSGGADPEGNPGAPAFVDGDYIESVGLTGDGITFGAKFLDTGFIPSFSPDANSCAIGVYSLAASSAAQRAALYSLVDTPYYSSWEIDAPWSDGIIYTATNVVGSYDSAPATYPPRLVVGARTGSVSNSLYINGVLSDTQADPGGLTQPEYAVSVFASDLTGGYNSKGPFGGYFVSNGLDANQVAQLSAAWRVLQQGLGRA